MILIAVSLCTGHLSKTYPSFLTVKEGSTSHLGLLPSGKKKETALRCSEPLRYRVGGPSKVYARFCGMGPHGDGMLIGNARLMFGVQHKHINCIVDMLYSIFCKKALGIYPVVTAHSPLILT